MPAKPFKHKRIHAQAEKRDFDGLLTWVTQVVEGTLLTREFALKHKRIKVIMHNSTPEKRDFDD